MPVTIETDNAIVHRYTLFGQEGEIEIWVWHCKLIHTILPQYVRPHQATARERENGQLLSWKCRRRTEEESGFHKTMRHYRKAVFCVQNDQFPTWRPFNYSVGEEVPTRLSGSGGVSVRLRIHPWAASQETDALRGSVTGKEDIVLPRNLYYHIIHTLHGIQNNYYIVCSRVTSFLTPTTILGSRYFVWYNDTVNNVAM